MQSFWKIRQKRMMAPSLPQPERQQAQSKNSATNSSSVPLWGLYAPECVRSVGPEWVPGMDRGFSRGRGVKIALKLQTFSGGLSL